MYTLLECKVHKFGTLGNYKFVDVFAIHNDKWIFCKQKEKTTWENPGGHIEIEEEPFEAAKRELFEETGAIDYDIEPLCDYWVNLELNGNNITAHGQVYFANVHLLSKIPEESEMEQIGFFDFLPQELTWPITTEIFFPIALKRKMDFS